MNDICDYSWGMKYWFYCKQCKRYQMQIICTVNSCRYCGYRLPCVWEREK